MYFGFKHNQVIICFNLCNVKNYKSYLKTNSNNFLINRLCFLSLFFVKIIHKCTLFLNILYNEKSKLYLLLFLLYQ